MDGIWKLENTIQNYAWGSRTFIPELLRLPSPSDRPMAEVWIGAHPLAPSVALTATGPQPLTELLAERARFILGSRLTTFPFLLKILAADRALSIQTHPNRAQALTGFAREEADGVLRNAPHRKYRDENDKPEIVCALTPLVAQKGFRSPVEIAHRLGAIAAPCVGGVLGAFAGTDDAADIRRLMRELLTLPAVDVAALTRAAAAAASGREDDLAWRWVAQLCREYPGDIGVVGPLLLNIVELVPGEALYTASGEVHGYLRGMGVELMVNSDNVLRCGLTEKHIDVDELLAVMDASPQSPTLSSCRRLTAHETVFDCPSDEFQLGGITVADGAIRCSAAGQVRLLLCTDGAARASVDGESVALAPGECLLIAAEAPAFELSGHGYLHQAAPAGATALSN